MNLTDAVEKQDLTDDEQRELIRRIQEDDCEDSKVKMLGQYIDAINWCCLMGLESRSSALRRDIYDLRESHAVEALLTAINHFRLDEPVRPCTYIITCIHRSKFRIDSLGPIRVPGRYDESQQDQLDIVMNTRLLNDTTSSYVSESFDRVDDADEAEFNSGVLREAVKSLSGVQRKVVEAYLESDGCQSEAARKLGWSRQRFNGPLMRALASLADTAETHIASYRRSLAESEAPAEAHHIVPNAIPQDAAEDLAFDEYRER